MRKYEDLYVLLHLKNSTLHTFLIFIFASQEKSQLYSSSINLFIGSKLISQSGKLINIHTTHYVKIQ